MSWRENLRKVEPYVAGEQPKMRNLVKLNTNENPYGPGEKVQEAIKAFDSGILNLYPNPDGEDLRHALASYHGLNDDQVYLGNGSDAVLAIIFLTCFNGAQKLLFPDITYSFYPVYCELYHIDYERVPLKEDFTINKEDYYKDNGGVIFPNPNAPTGCLLSREDIEDILKHNTDSVVVIDEAYIDFGGESVIDLVNTYENLIVVQTFSKFRSLAGIRLGAAFGGKEIISHLYDVKNSFNSYPVDALAQKIGLASVEDSDYIKDNAKKVMATRARTCEELKALGFEMTDSYANFIFVTHPKVPAKELFHKLRERSIIVRYFDQPRIDNYMRITIGTDEQMDRLIEALKELVK